MSSIRKVNFKIRNFECYSLVWLCSYQQILPFLVRLLHFLLESRHNSEFRFSGLVDDLLRELKLKKKRPLVCVRILLSDDAVAWLPNFLVLLCDF